MQSSIIRSAIKGLPARWGLTNEEWFFLHIDGFFLPEICLTENLLIWLWALVVRIFDYRPKKISVKSKLYSKGIIPKSFKNITQNNWTAKLFCYNIIYALTFKEDTAWKSDITVIIFLSLPIFFTSGHRLKAYSHAWWTGFRASRKRALI